MRFRRSKLFSDNDCFIVVLPSREPGNNFELSQLLKAAVSNGLGN